MNNENQKLIKLPVKDLAKKIISDGHVYLSIGEKKFYLMKPGVLVDPAFIKKHAAANQQFDFDLVVNVEVKEVFKKLFKELKYLQFEKDLRNKSYEIVQQFAKIYSGNEHFLSFALACYEEFCQVSYDDQLRMHDTDMHLFKKSLYAAAFSIITGLGNDYFHYLMLRDFYNLTFCLDIGLCEENYSYFVAEACNAENREPGRGVKYLTDEKASEFETLVYLKHPEKTYYFLKQALILSYPELAEVSLYQHELIDGSGFPRGIVKGQVSNWEAVIIYSESLVEIAYEYPFETDVMSYLGSFQNKKLKDDFVNKVHKKLNLILQHFGKLKETGT
jgi:hypothetical protein